MAAEVSESLERRQVLSGVSADPTVLFEETFDSSDALDESHWDTNSTNAGRIRVRNGRLEMDSSVRRKSSLNEAVLQLNLEGKQGVQLTFDHVSVSDEPRSMSASFRGHQNSDGVAFSADGQTWHRLVSLTGNMTQKTYDLDAAAAAAGVQYTSNFQIKFQQYDNYPMNVDGRAFDNIRVTHQPGGNRQVLVRETFTNADALQSEIWETYSSQDGRLRVRNGRLEMDTDGFRYALNEAILHVDLTDRKNIVLAFDHDSSYDESRSMPATFTGHHNSDGVAISGDGQTWHRLTTLSGDFSQRTFHLDAILAAAGITNRSDIRIKFQQYDNLRMPWDGRAFDNITLTANEVERNLPPQLERVDDVELYEGEVQTVTLRATDPNLGDKLTYSIQAQRGFFPLPELPDYLNLKDNGDGTATLTISPTFATITRDLDLSETTELRVRVTDENGSFSSTRFDVQVNDALQAYISEQGTLTVEGSFRWRNEIYVDPIGSDTVRVRALVDGRTLTQSFDRSDIEAVKISASASNNFDDHLQNNTRIRSLLQGFSGNDTLVGGDGEDILFGGHGNDLLHGLGGNDRYGWANGHDGNDIVRDLSGIDTLDFSAVPFAVNVDLRLTSDSIRGAKSFNDKISVELKSDVENVIGTFHNDTIRGSGANNHIEGLRGNDTIEGFLGDDVLDGGSGNDIYLYSGRTLGSDTIIDESGSRDRFDFQGMERGVYADLAGISTELTSGGLKSSRTRITLKDDTSIEDVLGSQFDDVILGNGAENYLDGKKGDDRIDGRGNKDIVIGREGDNTLIGGAGDDDLYGGVDSDTFVYLSGDNGRDRIFDEGGDDDWFDFSAMSTGVLVQLRYSDNWHSGMSSMDGAKQMATLSGGQIEHVIGTSKNDVIVGDDRDNILRGGDGNDVLTGLGGNDVLRGQAGKDSLSGDAGNDSLFGGIDAEEDWLNWGSGNDRLLLWPGDVVRRDLYSTLTDALVYFRNGTTTTRNGSKVTAASWTEEEIDLVDEAFGRTVDVLGNVKLLEDSDGRSITFYRNGTKNGDRSIVGSADDDDRWISLYDGAFRDDNEAMTTVIHELGHFRDEHHEWPGVLDGGITLFRRISGWYSAVGNARKPGWTLSGDVKWYHFTSVSNEYITNEIRFPDWADGYAKHNPKEDFAESLAAYFMKADYSEKDDARGATADWVNERVALPKGKMHAIDDLMKALR